MKHQSVQDACPRFIVPYSFCLLFFFLTAAVSAQRLQIEARIGDGPWVACHNVNVRRDESYLLRIDSIPGGTVSWYQIIPDCRQLYKNANFPWEKDPYVWIGFAKISYFREEMTELRGKWTITPTFRCTSFHSPCFHDTIGSYWIQAVVNAEGKTNTSYGIEDSDRRGLSPRVFRVSVRASDDYPGYITTFFNVPGLFGSTPYQCSNYIGVDCADVLMAAYAKWKGIASVKDYNVAMVVTALKKRAVCSIAAGIPDTIIRWNAQVRPGDLIAVRYAGARQFQHIGALYRDANANGRLDAEDLVLQAGPFPLTISPLGDGSFDGDVVLLRQE